MKEFSEVRFRSKASKVFPNRTDLAVLREKVRNYCYLDIFDELKELPKSTQVEVIKATLTDFTTGAEEIAQELVRMNTLPHFGMLKEFDFDYLCEKGREIQLRFQEEPLPIRYVRCASDKAPLFMVKTSSYKNAHIEMPSSSSLLYLLRRCAGVAVLGDNLDYEYAQQNISWIYLREELKPRKNPFEPLFDLFEVGARPIGQTTEGVFEIGLPIA